MKLRESGEPVAGVPVSCDMSVDGCALNSIRGATVTLDSVVFKYCITNCDCPRDNTRRCCQ